MSEACAVPNCTRWASIRFKDISRRAPEWHMVCRIHFKELSEIRQTRESMDKQKAKRTQLAEEVFVHLLEHRPSKRSTGQLAKDFKVSVRSMRIALLELKKAGMVQRLGLMWSAPTGVEEPASDPPVASEPQPQHKGSPEDSTATEKAVHEYLRMRHPVGVTTHRIAKHLEFQADAVGYALDMLHSRNLVKRTPSGWLLVAPILAGAVTIGAVKRAEGPMQGFEKVAPTPGEEVIAAAESILADLREGPEPMHIATQCVGEQGPEAMELLEAEDRIHRRSDGLWHAGPSSSAPPEPKVEQVADEVDKVVEAARAAREAANAKAEGDTASEWVRLGIGYDMPDRLTSEGKKVIAAAESILKRIEDAPEPPLIASEFGGDEGVRALKLLEREDRIHFRVDGFWYAGSGKYVAPELLWQTGQNPPSEQGIAPQEAAERLRLAVLDALNDAHPKHLRSEEIAKILGVKDRDVWPYPLEQLVIDGFVVKHSHWAGKGKIGGTHWGLVTPDFRAELDKAAAPVLPESIQNTSATVLVPFATPVDDDRAREITIAVGRLLQSQRVPEGPTIWRIGYLDAKLRRS